MNWTIIIIEALVLTALFTAMILIPLVKNPVWWIADYPEDIQEEYFKTHERIPSKFFTPTVLLKKGMALLIALALLLLVVWLAGTYDFWSALCVGYGIWLFIDWYDCFFLDWVLFANIKSVRLPGTEHMDAAYHQKKYHFVQSCWGMLIGLIPCLIGACIYALLISGNPQSEPNISFMEAHNYFVRNDVTEPIPAKIASQDEFEHYFGMAAFMGKNRQPTPIDFEKQFAITVVLPETNHSTELHAESLTDDGQKLIFTYSVDVAPEENTWTQVPMLLIFVDRQYERNSVELQEQAN